MTVTTLEPMPWDDAPPAGVEVHPTRLGELMPVGARTQTERAAELERICFVEGQLAAYKAEVLAAMARDSSARDYRSPGAPSTAGDEPSRGRTTSWAT